MSVEVHVRPERVASTRDHRYRSVDGRPLWDALDAWMYDNPGAFLVEFWSGGSIVTVTDSDMRRIYGAARAAMGEW